jgi:hypothetical protein
MDIHLVAWARHAGWRYGKSLTNGAARGPSARRFGKAVSAPHLGSVRAVRVENDLGWTASETADYLGGAGRVCALLHRCDLVHRETISSLATLVTAETCRAI